MIYSNVVMNNLLSSWKEIAKYLRVSDKTAQTWKEDLGMPVKQLRRRGGVFAYKDELDAWRESHSLNKNDIDVPDTKAVQPNDNGTGHEADAGVRPSPIMDSELVKIGDPGSVEPVTEGRSSKQDILRADCGAQEKPSVSLERRKVILGIAASAVVAAGGFWFRSARRRRMASSPHVENSTLTILDQENQVLWRHVFNQPLNSVSYHPATRKAWIGDLDGSGIPRVLFIADPSIEGAEQCTLYCFDNDGKELWRFFPGRKIRTVTEEFTASYYGSQI